MSTRHGTTPRDLTASLSSPWLTLALAGLVVALAAAVVLAPALIPPTGSTPTPAASSSCLPTLAPSPVASPGPSSCPTPTVPAPSGPTPQPSFVRPTPSPIPTFMSYRVQSGDTLTSIADRFRTTARSIAWWNRGTYPSLDPESSAYQPNRIEVGWLLVLIPGIVVDETNPPTPSPGPSGTPVPTLQPSPTAAPATPQPTGAPASVVSHGSRTRAQIALTFDMGGRLDPAVDIVQWLIDHQVPATLFPTGSSGSTTSQGKAALELAAAHPELFDLGNHSWNHPDFRELTAAQMADQLTRTEAALSPLLGETTKPWFRPPFGGYNDAVRAGVGAAGWGYLVMWDVDTIDWRPESQGGPTTAEIVAKVTSKAQNGSIVLMHLGGWHTLEALPGILDALEAKALEPVTLRTMLGR